jgi:fructose-bisphosphate aldolase/6-deoxy-5-ketofructose 1-phosphate synthase
MNTELFVPADVPPKHIKTFKKNFNQATSGTGRLMLFAGDQKVEHLNADFFGAGIAEDDANPIHLFQIAAKAKVGVFATQLGLVSRYAPAFPNIPYLIKLNSKTNLVAINEDDPLSKAWYTVKQVVELAKNTGLHILGVGYTVYLGSIYEAEMLHEAKQLMMNMKQAW